MAPKISKTAFSQKDKDQLALYFVSNKVSSRDRPRHGTYKDVAVRLPRHTVWSWYEHYKRNRDDIDRRAEKFTRRIARGESISVEPVADSDSESGLEPDDSGSDDSDSDDEFDDDKDWEPLIRSLARAREKDESFESAFATLAMKDASKRTAGDWKRYYDRNQGEAEDAVLELVRRRREKALGVRRIASANEGGDQTARGEAQEQASTTAKDKGKARERAPSTDVGVVNEAGRPNRPSTQASSDKQGGGNGSGSKASKSVQPVASTSKAVVDPRPSSPWQRRRSPPPNHTSLALSSPPKHGSGTRPPESRPAIAPADPAPAAAKRASSIRPVSTSTGPNRQQPSPLEGTEAEANDQEPVTEESSSSSRRGPSAERQLRDEEEAEGEDSDDEPFTAADEANLVAELARAELEQREKASVWTTLDNLYPQHSAAEWRSHYMSNLGKFLVLVAGHIEELERIRREREERQKQKINRKRQRRDEVEEEIVVAEKRKGKDKGKGREAGMMPTDGRGREDRRSPDAALERPATAGSSDDAARANNRVGSRPPRSPVKVVSSVNHAAISTPLPPSPVKAADSPPRHPDRRIVDEAATGVVTARESREPVAAARIVRNGLVPPTPPRVRSPVADAAQPAKRSSSSVDRAGLQPPAPAPASARVQSGDVQPSPSRQAASSRATPLEVARQYPSSSLPNITEYSITPSPYLPGVLDDVEIAPSTQLDRRAPASSLLASPVKPDAGYDRGDALAPPQASLETTSSDRLLLEELERSVSLDRATTDGKDPGVGLENGLARDLIDIDDKVLVEPDPAAKRPPEPRLPSPSSSPSLAAKVKSVEPDVTASTPLDPFSDYDPSAPIWPEYTPQQARFIQSHDAALLTMQWSEAKIGGGIRISGGQERGGEIVDGTQDRQAADFGQGDQTDEPHRVGGGIVEPKQGHVMGEEPRRGTVATAKGKKRRRSPPRDPRTDRSGRIGGGSPDPFFDADHARVSKKPRIDSPLRPVPNRSRTGSATTRSSDEHVEEWRNQVSATRSEDRGPVPILRERWNSAQAILAKSTPLVDRAATPNCPTPRRPRASFPPQNVGSRAPSTLNPSASPRPAQDGVGDPRPHPHPATAVLALAPTSAASKTNGGASSSVRGTLSKTLIAIASEFGLPFDFVRGLYWTCSAPLNLDLFKQVVRFYALRPPADDRSTPTVKTGTEELAKFARRFEWLEDEDEALFTNDEARLAEIEKTKGKGSVEARRQFLRKSRIEGAHQLRKSMYDRTR
ncbi:hypothetical protein JCM10212_003648 [Sporobolomyces blumeae]